MPLIPKFTIPSVDETPVRLPELQAPGVVPMRDYSARGSQAISEGLARMSAMAFQMQSQIDDAKVREADGMLARYTDEALDHPQHGYRLKLNKSALDAYQGTVTDYQKKRKEIEGTLDNDVQRQMFNGVADQRTAAFLSDVNGHFSRQAKNYDSTTTAARIGVKQRDAVSIWRNSPPDQRDAALDRVLRGNDSVISEVKRLAEISGMPTDGEGSEIYRDSVRTKLSQVHKQIVGSMVASQDFDGAKKYLDRVSSQDELDPDDFADINNSLRKSVLDDYSTRATDQIIDATKGRSLVERLDTLRAIYDAAPKDGSSRMTAEVRSKIEARLRQRDQDERESRAAQTNEDMVIAQEFLTRNPSASIDTLETQDPELHRRLMMAGKLPALREYTGSDHRFETKQDALYEIDYLKSLTEPTLTVEKKKLPFVGPPGPRIDSMQPDEYVLDTRTDLPLRDMSDAQIRARFSGRLSATHLDRVIREAQDMRGGKSRTHSGASGSGSSAQGDVPTRKLLDVIWTEHAIKSGLADAAGNPFKDDPKKLADYNAEQRRYDEFCETRAFKADPKSDELRKPNPDEIRAWTATRQQVAGKVIRSGFFGATEVEVTEREYESLPAEVQSTLHFDVSVGGVTKQFAPSKIPQDELKKLIVEMRAIGLPPTTKNISDAYLKAHGNRVPGEIDPSSVTAAVVLSDAAPTLDYREELIKKVEKYEQSVTAASQNTWLPKTSTMMRAVKPYAEVSEAIQGGVVGTIEKAASAIGNLLEGALGVGMSTLDWALGDSQMRDKYMADGSLNPEYVAEIRSFARWHGTGSAIDSFGQLLKNMGNDPDPERSYDKEIEQWVLEHDPVVFRMPQYKARALLYDIVLERWKSDPRAELVMDKVYAASRKLGGPEQDGKPFGTGPTKDIPWESGSGPRIK